ncbi:MAG: hypothetical protein AAB930_03485, partial [Patescibacteria group bacterium]
LKFRRVNKARRAEGGIPPADLSAKAPPAGRAGSALAEVCLLRRSSSGYEGRATQAGPREFRSLTCACSRADRAGRDIFKQTPPVKKRVH